MVDRVLLYDVDPVNPYGRELAAVLRDAGIQVTLVCSRAVRWVPDGVDGRPILAASRPGASLPAVLGRRVFGVLRAAAWAAGGRTPVVVVWSRDAWDALVLAVLAAVTGRVVVIDHNPTAERRAHGFKGWAERLLRGRARLTVVHDGVLDPDPTAPRAVVTHPPYVEWRRRFVSERPGEPMTRVLLLGAMRADKGASDVVELLPLLPAHTDVTVVGKGPLPTGWAEAAARAGVRLSQIGGNDFVPDERLGAELSRGGVMLAPYIGATQSGTVLLAITCSLPVLGYATGALPSVLTDESLVDCGDVAALAALFARYLSRPWPTARMTDGELTERCRRDWQAALAQLTTST